MCGRRLSNRCRAPGVCPAPRPAGGEGARGRGGRPAPRPRRAPLGARLSARARRARAAVRGRGPAPRGGSTAPFTGGPAPRAGPGTEETRGVWRCALRLHLSSLVREVRLRVVTRVSTVALSTTARRAHPFSASDLRRPSSSSGPIKPCTNACARTRPRRSLPRPLPHPHPRDRGRSADHHHHRPATRRRTRSRTLREVEIAPRSHMPQQVPAGRSYVYRRAERATGIFIAPGMVPNGSRGRARRRAAHG